MARDPQDIQNFIDTKGNYPNAIINPDSVLPVQDKLRTFSGYYYAEFNFKTLDGSRYQTGTNNFNSSTKYSLLIHDHSIKSETGYTMYMIEKPQKNPLFTFDARLLLTDNTTVDYEYISYDTESWNEETITTNKSFTTRRYANAGEVNTPDANGKYPIFHVFSLNENLNELITQAGFTTNFDLNETLFNASIVSDNVTSIEWKFRSRIVAGTYFSGASFYNEKYVCLSDPDKIYENETRNISGLSDMRTWIDGVYPGWT